MNCDVTVEGQTFRASTPATLSVAVLMGAEITNPAFQSWDSITVAEVGGVWKVTGQGNFSRSAPLINALTLPTSQFYGKIMAHENKHITQWTSELPWKMLYDANTLYATTLSILTGTSEGDLRNKIDAAVLSKKALDNMVTSASRCDGEEAAYAVEIATPPDFLEMTVDEWKMLYSCP